VGNRSGSPTDALGVRIIRSRKVPTNRTHPRPRLFPGIRAIRGQTDAVSQPKNQGNYQLTQDDADPNGGNVKMRPCLLALALRSALPVPLAVLCLTESCGPFINRCPHATSKNAKGYRPSLRPNTFGFAPPIGGTRPNRSGVRLAQLLLAVIRAPCSLRARALLT